MDLNPDSKDMEWSRDYDSLSMEERDLWRLSEYFKMRTMIDEYYSTFDKNKELIAWMNSIVEDHPRYQVVIDLLDKNNERNDINRYTGEFLCEVANHVARNVRD